MRTTAARSRGPRSKRSTSTNCHNSPHKSAKTRGSYLPETKVLRIQEHYLAGQNKSEIARKEHCDRETVARIVEFPEVRNFIEQQRKEFLGLIPDAMAAVRYTLQVPKDGKLGYQILQETGMVHYPGEQSQLRTEEELMSRECDLLAAVLLEAHRVYGIELPKEFNDALAKDKARQKSDPENPARGSTLKGP